MGEEKSRQKKPVTGNFYNTHITVHINASYFQCSFFHLLAEGWIQTIIAVESLFYFHFLVGPVSQGIRYKPDVLSLAHKRTGKQADQQCGSGGIGLFVVGILNVENISGILYQSMLETASSAQKGDASFTGKPDGIQRANHALVRTARRAPEGMIRP